MPTDTEPRSFDCIIIGQGLAGSTLAWQLHWRGLRCLIIDRDDDVSSSKVAGGLMTPVTGQRVVPTWRLDEFWPAATSFYARVENETNTRLLHQPGHVRLFRNELERKRFESRDLSNVSTPIRQPDRLVDSDLFENQFGGFEMPTAGRMDVRGYLDTTRSFFEQSGLYMLANVETGHDVKPSASCVELPRLSVRAPRLVFCEGFAARLNPWLRGIEFDATRGELLTIRVPGLSETRIVGCGVWIAPLGAELFRVGSTYDWKNLDAGPTDSGREELSTRLRQFLKLPFEVVDHTAAVRPIVVGRHPVMGILPDHPRLAVFNGLGSKGSLQAPFLAAQLAEVLIDDREVDESVDLRKRFPLPGRTAPTESQLRLTERAHAAVKRVVRTGEPVIDATAGNGHDTCFLARIVGPSGQVFAFDVQPDALNRTRQRLAQNGFENVATVLDDHARMTDAIPPDQQRNIAAVMFNLGYLPGGNKSVITTAASTIPAIRAALDMLRPGGVVTVLAYPGHPGGEAEATAVEEALKGLQSEQFFTETFHATPMSSTSPKLHVITRITQ